MTPQDKKFAKSHEWIKVVDDTAIVGISDHAQEALGDVTFVELPEVGSVIEAQKECGVIESVKAASDIYMPVSGKISEVNSVLDDNPEKINESPYEDGWIFKITDFNKSDLDNLMSADEYDTFLESQE